MLFFCFVFCFFFEGGGGGGVKALKILVLRVYLFTEISDSVIL